MTGALKWGLHGFNTGAGADPEVMLRAVRAAEEAGFDSAWTAEHVVLPDPRVPPSPLPPEFPMLDPLVALSYAAAHTSRLLLATGIVILPQRNPLVLAKQVASLDVLSGGRVVLGIGVGYLRPEFEAVGVPFEERGARTDEYVAAMRALWSEDEPAYRGRFVSFGGVRAHPRPARRDVPIVIGGHSKAAYRRTVRSAEGWYGYGLDLPGVVRCLGELREAGECCERPAQLHEVEVTVNMRIPVDLEVARRLADLGVHRVVLNPPSGMGGVDMEGYVRAVGETLVGRV